LKAIQKWDFQPGTGDETSQKFVFSEKKAEIVFFMVNLGIPYQE